MYGIVCFGLTIEREEVYTPFINQNNCSKKRRAITLSPREIDTDEAHEHEAHRFPGLKKVGV